MALCATLPGFERALLGDDGNARYVCLLGKRTLGEDQLGLPAGNEEIRIAPVIRGSKRGGLLQTILGAALIALAIWNPMGWVALGAQGAMGTTMMFGMGFSLAMGGITQMLTPQQRGLSTRDSPDNGASYNFNGPVNTTAEGNPVPVLYGEMFVGSAVVSAGIYAQDQA